MMQGKLLSRRGFLKAAGLTLTATTLTCSGLGYAVTRTPEIETPELIFEKDITLQNRVLVTFSTRAGSTVEVTAAMGESLCQRGFTVDVKPVKEKPSLWGYQAAILDSAIRMGKWLPEAVEFVKTNHRRI